MKRLAVIVGLLLSFGLALAQKNPSLPSDSAQIRTALTGFYKWYAANWKKLSGFRLYKSENKKQGPPYVIDWKEAERYFGYIRKNVPYVGEAFIETERRHYKTSEEDFKKFPEDELPSGFDYDPFTGTQEDPAYFLSELTKSTNKWYITVQGEEAFVTVETRSDGQPVVYSHLFCGDMKKEKGKWKIARVDCDLTIGE